MSLLASLGTSCVLAELGLVEEKVVDVGVLHLCGSLLS